MKWKLKQTAQRPRETKRWFFVRIIKTDRLLAKLTKREKRQFITIRDGKGGMIEDATEIPRMARA